MAGNAGRSPAKRPTSSAARCWASAALPPLPAKRIFRPDCSPAAQAWARSVKIWCVAVSASSKSRTCRDLEISVRMCLFIGTRSVLQPMAIGPPDPCYIAKRHKKVVRLHLGTRDILPRLQRILVNPLRRSRRSQLANVASQHFDVKSPTAEKWTLREPTCFRPGAKDFRSALGIVYGQAQQDRDRGGKDAP